MRNLFRCKNRGNPLEAHLVCCETRGAHWQPTGSPLQMLQEPSKPTSRPSEYLNMGSSEMLQKPREPTMNPPGMLQNPREPNRSPLEVLQKPREPPYTSFGSCNNKVRGSDRNRPTSAGRVNKAQVQVTEYYTTVFALRVNIAALLVLFP